MNSSTRSSRRMSRMPRVSPLALLTRNTVALRVLLGVVPQQLHRRKGVARALVQQRALRVLALQNQLDDQSVQHLVVLVLESLERAQHREQTLDFDLGLGQAHVHQVFADFLEEGRRPEHAPADVGALHRPLALDFLVDRHVSEEHFQQVLAVADSFRDGQVILAYVLQIEVLREELLAAAVLELAHVFFQPPVDVEHARQLRENVVFEDLVLALVFFIGRIARVVQYIICNFFSVKTCLGDFLGTTWSFSILREDPEITCNKKSP